MAAKKKNVVDPLSVFLDLRDQSVPRRRGGAKPFASGEHLWLGGAGAANACAELRGEGVIVDATLFQSIPRLKSPQRLSYGELVALSGDFYGSPEALYEEKPSALPWLYESNDLDDLRKLFGSELQWIEQRQKGRGPDSYPDNNIRMAWNAKAYVELALANTDHFGWHNLVAYVRHHTAALTLAKRAKGEENETFQRALFVNAFADHFLTDGFAAGHIRVPRAEIREWAKKLGYSEKLAGALSKLLHDQDGHVTSVHSKTEDTRPEKDGLRVKNAAGDEWFTRCDGQLFLPADASETPSVSLPVAAVSASVKELLLAWKKGALPEGAFAATRLVPFPHPSAQGLADKFAPSMPRARFDALVKSVDWFAHIPWIGPGLKAEHVAALFDALPELMAALRKNIKTELKADPSLKKRLASGYVDAFLQLS